VSLVLASRVQGLDLDLDLEGPGLGLDLEGPGLGLEGPVLGLRILALTTTLPTSVNTLHLLECVLYAQLTPGHVYLVTYTMDSKIAVSLPLPLVCGTVC